MLIMAFKPGHDGSLAAIADRELLLSLESEKDSFPRHALLTPSTVLDVAARLNRIPDVVALGGWYDEGWVGNLRIGAGYRGTETTVLRPMDFFGKQVQFFSSSHERSHIMMAVGMAPKTDHDLQVVLVWEGALGGFYVVDAKARVIKSIPVLSEPGARYSLLYALADPTFPDSGAHPPLHNSGKLMALAAYGNAANADAGIVQTVDRLLTLTTVYPAPKHLFQDSPVYNAGVESEPTKIAAALLSARIFDIFQRAAETHLPAGKPLLISGGCGLNCDWNGHWKQLGFFSSVFVPPCPNDSGSAIGTAIDALAELTGSPEISWSVYAGLEFELDWEPASPRWHRRPLEYRSLAQALANGRVAAWVQGRWEIGPRALGNRSILAEPFNAGTRDRLNRIKQREGYRPIAPCCRLEEVGRFFAEDFADPYMLYFRHVSSRSLQAVTHVDGTARVQTVSTENNRQLYDLLSAFSAHTGAGVLCNTSLNFQGYGFINRMSDLVRFCEGHGVDDMVVGDAWFQRTDADVPREDARTE